MRFNQLCDEAYSSTEYRALADNVHTLVLTHVPVLSLERRDLLRRFIVLVDELYE